jgi:hypothetical protein
MCFVCGPWRDVTESTVGAIGKNVSSESEDIIKIRHQATAAEDTAGWEDLVCPIVIFDV